MAGIPKPNIKIPSAGKVASAPKPKAPATPQPKAIKNPAPKLQAANAGMKNYLANSKANLF